MNNCATLENKVIRECIEVFEDRMLGLLWLNTPNSIFEFQTPLRFIAKGSVGGLRVLTILERMRK